MALRAGPPEADGLRTFMVGIRWEQPPREFRVVWAVALRGGGETIGRDRKQSGAAVVRRSLESQGAAYRGREEGSQLWRCSARAGLCAARQARTAHAYRRHLFIALAAAAGEDPESPFGPFGVAAVKHRLGALQARPANVALALPGDWLAVAVG